MPIKNYKGIPCIGSHCLLVVCLFRCACHQIVFLLSLVDAGRSSARSPLGYKPWTGSWVRWISCWWRRMTGCRSRCPVSSLTTGIWRIDSTVWAPFLFSTVHGLELKMVSAEVRLCFGYSLPQTPLEWEPLALGLPFFVFLLVLVLYFVLCFLASWWQRSSSVVTFALQLNTLFHRITW
jgi:hypothetical protein